MEPLTIETGPNTLSLTKYKEDDILYSEIELCSIFQNKKLKVFLTKEEAFKVADKLKSIFDEDIKRD